MHLFRTKARCVNCHNGPLFTDNQFHNLGLTYYGREYEDLGRYEVTKLPEDVGKFKTPSLRDVMRTRPWFHNGLFDDMDGVLNMYNNGMPQPKPKPEQENDPLFPKTSPHIKKLGLTKEERDAVVAFLDAISSSPFRILPPDLPK
ncbi:Methylamine utilization protein MauG precursor [compost metagenome]